MTSWVDAVARRARRALHRLAPGWGRRARRVVSPWRRSLSLRVVSITLLVSSLLVAAFGYFVITCNCGTEMFGNNSCGIWSHASSPKTMSPMMTIVVITGRFTKSAANFILAASH